jgi:hypothetical protein
MKTVLLKNLLVLIIPIVSIFSCTTSKLESQPDSILQELIEANQESPAAVPDSAPVAVPPPVPAPVATGEEAPFDPGSISRVEYNAAKSEMQRLVKEINRDIRAKDYTAWTSYLSDDFIRRINSPKYLAELSQSSLLLRTQNIQLKSPRDYFTQVVVPLWENIPIDAYLDDIEFISHNLVKVFTLYRNQRLRLFEFVRAGDTWKVAPPI